MPTAVLRNRDLVPMKKKTGAARFLPYFLLGMGTALLVALVIRASLLVPVHLGNKDMEPRLSQGRSYFVRMGPIAGAIAAGDLVWLQHPHASGIRMVRRVAAIGGDRVRAGKKLFVNNQAIEAASVALPTFKEQELLLAPADFYVVAEEAGSGALDSRTFGPVHRRDILGKVWF